MHIVVAALKELGDKFDWTQPCTVGAWHSVLQVIRKQPACKYVFSTSHLNGPLSELGRQDFVNYLNIKCVPSDAFAEPLNMIEGWDAATEEESLEEEDG
jgi:hypothetical protein